METIISERFLIQITRNKSEKSGYMTRFSSENANQAELLYGGINIGNGYKKRLVVIDSTGAKRVIRRAVS